MNFLTQLKEALNNLAAGKLRSILAVIGILVGTGSVVAMISCGQLATRQAIMQFKELGTDLLSASISDSAPGDSNTKPKEQLTLNTIEGMKQQIPLIELVAPYTTVFGDLAYQGQKVDGSIIGATADLKPVIKIHLAAGRFISPFDGESLFGVIGNDVATKLKAQGMLNPLGKQLRFGNHFITIIGVAEPWPENSFFYQNINQSVILPLSAAALLSKYSEINNIVMKLVPNADIDAVKSDIEGYLAKATPDKRLFVRSPKQLIESMQKQSHIFTLLLCAIGGISLLVGGIGVMNIMLVSVVERKKEIGLRMAVGARRRDIQFLFLFESICLTLFGGLLGVVLGISVSWIISFFAHWDFTIFYVPPLIGFLVSVATGIFFGFYPAYQASKLDPIQTLRSD